MSSGPARLGLRENLPQFALLVAVNAFVGAMVGLERSTLPLIGREDFGLSSSAAVVSFIAAFGLAKAFTNLGAGAFATKVGRRRLLIAGWALALPVPLLIAGASSWSWVVAANVLLGVNQGLAWSMTVVMKIDLVGPKRRGFALGLNEAAGYGGVALAAAVSGWLAAEFAARDVLIAAGALIAFAGLLMSVFLVRDTAVHVALEQSEHTPGTEASAPSMRAAFPEATWKVPALRSASQAGLVNNLNDALAWGLVPLFMAAKGAGPGQIGLVAGIYPAVWGLGQIWTGHWSDRIGRKPLITGGMLLQALALVLLSASSGAVGLAALSAVLLGVGTALVYPTLIAAISDAVEPVARAAMVGVYRFWRDMGYVAGALISGLIADALGFSGAVAVIAALTAASGIWVALDMPARARRRSLALPPAPTAPTREQRLQRAERGCDQRDDRVEDVLDDSHARGVPLRWRADTLRPRPAECRIQGMRVHVLEHSQRLPGAPQEVFAFFAEAYNLEEITPPFLGFEVVTPRPIEMREGTLIDYRLTLHGVRLRWRTRIEVWEPGQRFVDRQLSGPYRLWHHTHLFERDGSDTIMRDVVRYALPLGPLGELARLALVRRDLERIFAFRAREIRRRFTK